MFKVTVVTFWLTHTNVKCQYLLACNLQGSRLLQKTEENLFLCRRIKQRAKYATHKPLFRFQLRQLSERIRLPFRGGSPLFPQPSPPSTVQHSCGQRDGPADHAPAQRDRNITARRRKTTGGPKSRAVQSLLRTNSDRLGGEKSVLMTAWPRDWVRAIA